jgi:pyrimidine and pyridine-specific 5'-nucleotidase
MTSSIPSLASRRISAPVQGFPRLDSITTVNAMTPSSYKPLSESPNSYLSSKQPDIKPSPSGTESAPGARSTAANSPESPLHIRNVRESPELSRLSLHRPQMTTTPPRRALTKSSSVASGLRVTESPSISLTTPSSKKKLNNDYSSPSTPPKTAVNNGSTPTKPSKPNSIHEPNSQMSYNGSQGSTFSGANFPSPPRTGIIQKPALLSESAALLQSGLITEEDSPFSVWDGDDLTLEMITDINDSSVDEEVSTDFRKPSSYWNKIATR